MLSQKSTIKSNKKVNKNNVKQLGWQILGVVLDFLNFLVIYTRVQGAVMLHAFLVNFPTNKAFEACILIAS